MSLNKKHIIPVGRGSTAIFLALINSCRGKEVIVPANVCYAAVFPIIFSQNKPIFADIDPCTGNTNLENIIKCTNSKTGAIIFPYMYGNVSPEILKIKQYCKSNNLTLIEDCASAMGGALEGKQIGTFGDYAIFSTGHAKNVDLGNGGILATDNPIEYIAEEYHKLPLFSDTIKQGQDYFSERYRQLRNTGDTNGIKELFLSVVEASLRDIFLYRIDNSDLEQKIHQSFKVASKEKAERVRKYQLYRNNITAKCRSLDYCCGSNPWRFSIIVDSCIRRKIITHFMSQQIFISDWYPDISKFFCDKGNKYASTMGDHILNFTLDASDDDILKSCQIINSFLKKETYEKN